MKTFWLGLDHIYWLVSYLDNLFVVMMCSSKMLGLFWRICVVMKREDLLDEELGKGNIRWYLQVQVIGTGGKCLGVLAAWLGIISFKKARKEQLKGFGAYTVWCWGCLLSHGLSYFSALFCSTNAVVFLVLQGIQDTGLRADSHKKKGRETIWHPPKLTLSSELVWEEDSCTSVLPVPHQPCIRGWLAALKAATAGWALTPASLKTKPLHQCNGKIIGLLCFCVCFITCWWNSLFSPSP